jgi:hypothetical protein
MYDSGHFPLCWVQIFVLLWLGIGMVLKQLLLVRGKIGRISRNEMHARITWKDG